MCLNTMPEFKILDEEGKQTLENPIFALIEAFCISWFTIDVVDVLAILPYYLSLVLMDEVSFHQF